MKRLNEAEKLSIQRLRQKRVQINEISDRLGIPFEPVFGMKYKCICNQSNP